MTWRADVLVLLAGIALLVEVELDAAGRTLTLGLTRPARPDRRLLLRGVSPATAAHALLSFADGAGMSCEEAKREEGGGYENATSVGKVDGARPAAVRGDDDGRRGLGRGRQTAQTPQSSQTAPT